MIDKAEFSEIFQMFLKSRYEASVQPVNIVKIIANGFQGNGLCNEVQIII